MKKTGLSRMQIYKWFFDTKKLSQNHKIAPEERISYSPDILRLPSHEDIEYGLAPQPIFKIEKVQRGSAQHL